MTTRPCETRAALPSGWRSERVDLAGWIAAKSTAVLGLDDVADQEVQAVLAGPRRRPRAAAAVPDAVGEAGRVRLDPGGELLEARGAGEGADGLAADDAQQPRDPFVAEVLGVGGVRVERGLDVVPVDRRADVKPG